MDTKVITKIIICLFVFTLFTGTVFWSIQLFTDSAESKPIEIQTALPASLQLPDKEVVVNSTTPENIQESPSQVQDVLPIDKVLVKDVQPKVSSILSVEVSDGNTKILFEKESKKKLPVASLTKLMTALVVLENYDLDQEVIISEQAMVQEGVQGVLKLGETLSVEDLLYIALIESSNRAAYALSEVMKMYDGTVEAGELCVLEKSNNRVMSLANTAVWSVDSK